MADNDTATRRAVDPSITATGAARMSGQGVATTSTARTLVLSCESSHAARHTRSVRGVNQTAYRSARRSSGDLLARWPLGPVELFGHTDFPCAGLRDQEDERAVLVEASAQEMDPQFGPDRQRFAREARGVHVGLAGRHRSIAGNHLPGAYQQAIAHRPLPRP